MPETYDYYDTENLFSVARGYLKREGIMQTTKRALVFLGDIPLSRLLFLKKQRYFTFNNRMLPYLYARYNKAWKNERAIEIPLFKQILGDTPSELIVEVGNVLQHYYPVNHIIVDKYEQAPGVINEDILSFNPGRKFKHIISISTIEHIGVDDRPQNPQKAVVALQKLQTLLTKDGTITLSFPANYNSALMQLVKKKVKGYAFKRYNRQHNLWKQCDKADILNFTGSPPEGIFLLQIKATDIL